MEHFQQYIDVIARWWRDLPSLSRRRLRFGVVLLSIFAAVWSIYRATPRYEFILSGRTFSQRELADIEAALAQAGFGNYDIKGGRLRVPRELRAEYLGALVAGNALPRHFDLETKNELDQSSPWESQEQRRARLKTAQQRELALILRAMNGIEDATVQLDESVTGPFRRERKMTAMVVVRPRIDEPLDVGVIRSIRNLVASSKVDLKPEDVTITDLATGRSFVGTAEDSALLRSDEFAIRKMTYQRDWQNQLSRMLSHIPGVQVAVNVDLQYETKSAMASNGEPKQATTVLVPSTVSVAIGIPESFYDTVYAEHLRQLSRVERSQCNDATASQIRQQQDERVTQLVRQVLPHQAAVQIAALQDSASSLSVASAKHWSSWSSFGWQTIALSLLSVGVLVLLVWYVANDPPRLRQRVAPAQNAVATAQEHRNTVGTALSAEDSFEIGPSVEGGHRTETDSTEYHHELTRIVRQDPDVAAAKLAEWIEKAA